MSSLYRPWWMPAAIIILLAVCILLTFALIIEKVSLDDRVADLHSSAEHEDKGQVYHWRLVTSWPKKFPGIGLGPETFADYVDRASNGRLKITVYGAGQLVPALGVFDVVSSGGAEMGHSGSYYWKGKIPAAVFFTTVPFGMNAQEYNGWLHHGGGLELWREIYAPFNLIPFAGGNTGVQMGGWFNREINSIEDIQGLKMRIPGLGGEVFTRVGGIAVNIPGGELFTALQSGVIDATEWVGPYNDLAFGFHQIAKYYYSPGWHEPGSSLEFIVNKQAFARLPSDLQAIVEVAARAANQDMLDEYTARNNAALVELVQKHNVELKTFPQDVIEAMRSASASIYSDMASNDPTFARVYAAYKDYLDGVKVYHKRTEQAYYEMR